MLFSQSVRPWETPELTAIARRPMHTTYHPCASVDEAKCRRRDASSWVRTLNGDWHLKVFRHPGLVLQAHVQAGLDHSDWAPVPVPANWNLHGFGKPPQYTNITMPFENTPPQVPEKDNPTGVYRTRFTLPADWAARRVVIHFGGVESCFFLYLNGAFVGMSKDSRLPAEFDLTANLCAGANDLAVVCMQYSDASYIEDQDHWWMAGIFRDVYLYSTEAIHLADIRVDGLYDPDTGQCRLRCGVTLGTVVEPGEDHAVEVRLHDGARPLGAPLVGTISRSYRVDSSQVCIEEDVGRLSPWNTEEPRLYTVVVTLRTASGRAIEHAAVRTGFRSVEVRDRQFLLNGKPVLIKGANHHDTDPDHGKRVDPHWVERDVVLMKQFNLNAIRTSHYPADPVLYDLCDEYGILVIDEANIECHANYRTLCHDPRWRNAFVERVVRMVERDRNHPCIIAWSLGNESGYGENHDAAADQVRRLDPTRLLHHEGAVKPRWDQGGPNAYEQGGERSNDFVNPMYPSIASMIDWARTTRSGRPFIMCEYCSTTGNSGGNLKEYWDAILAHHGLQGGFIWQWADHALRRTREDGREFWAYGGDFGETVHDYNFHCNGMVSPDRQPRPVLHEYKKLVQPILVRAVDLAGYDIEITNRDWFRSSDWLEGTWRLEIDGRMRQRGAIPGVLGPQESMRTRLPVAPFELRNGEQAILTISFRTRRKTAWCRKGHEVAWEQFVVGAAPFVPTARAAGSVAIERGEGRRVCVKASRMELVFDLRRGVIESLAAGGQPLVLAGPTFNLWRTPTDNDGIRARPDHRTSTYKALGRWLAAGYDRMRIRTVQAKIGSTADGTVVFWVEQEALPHGGAKGILFASEYAVHGDGTVRCTHGFEVPEGLADLPRLGVMLTVAPGLDQLEWHGRGPHESYPDRKAGAALGRYRGSVRGQHHDYIVPQENGLKCDTRWFALSGAAGRFEVRGQGASSFAFSAQHYAPQELERALHTDEVVFAPETTVIIDAVHRGLGSNACGPDTLPEYQIGPGRYELTYVMRVR